ncbi:hypothetical protein MAR_014523 [Mya arenaria]|uniref:TNF family profile domain-containing protein n=1 Tax=Mya arenaria TaxID=6604 RepID=A0ABY7G654_MYAAR|nr:uncharacterized protein LOC128219872 [Mya arenaria]XP_052783967.1 uncharacterized protein LOC128219872 [Mya arenaria]WAR28819.1 hypothetical protein MAR_014523 [Mya arenaria]
MINFYVASCTGIENKMPPENKRSRYESQKSTSTVMTDLSTDSDETGNSHQPTSAPRRPSNEQTPKERETKRAVRKRQVSFSNGADEADMSELQRLQSTNSNEIDSVIHQPNYGQQKYYKQQTSYTRVPLDDENLSSLQRKDIARTRRTRRYTEGNICYVDRDVERHMLENETGMHHSKTVPKLVYHEKGCKCQACYAEYKRREKELVEYLVENDREDRMPNRSYSLTSLHEQKIRHINNINPFCQNSRSYNTQRGHVDTVVQLNSQFQPYIHPIHKYNKSRSFDILDPIESGDGEVPRLGNPPCRPLPEVPIESDAGTSGYAQMDPTSKNSDPASSAQSESYHSSLRSSKMELLKHPLFRILLVLNVLLLLAITAGIPTYLYILNKDPVPISTTPDPGPTLPPNEQKDCLSCMEVQGITLLNPLDLGLVQDIKNRSLCCVEKGASSLKVFLEVISRMGNKSTEKTPRPVLQLTSMSAEKLSKDNTIIWSDKDGQKTVKSNTLRLVEGNKAVQINHGGLYYVSTKLSFISTKTSIDGESFAIGHQILVDGVTFEETSQMCYFPPTNKTLAVEHVSAKQFVKYFKPQEQISVQVKSKLNFKPESAQMILFYLGQSAH